MHVLEKSKMGMCMYVWTISALWCGAPASHVPPVFSHSLLVMGTWEGSRILVLSPMWDSKVKSLDADSDRTQPVAVDQWVKTLPSLPFFGLSLGLEMNTMENTECLDHVGSSRAAVVKDYWSRSVRISPHGFSSCITHSCLIIFYPSCRMYFFSALFENFKCFLLPSCLSKSPLRKHSQT